MPGPRYLSTDPHAGDAMDRASGDEATPLPQPKSVQRPSRGPSIGEAVTRAAGKTWGGLDPKLFTASDKEWAALPAGERLRRVMTVGAQMFMQPFIGQDAAREMLASPGASLAKAAAPVVAGKAVAAVKQALPSAERAGKNFQAVMQAARDQPVDVAKTGDVALRIADMAERGGAMPKAARDLLKRMTDPTKGDLTYQEARDFYSNISRLSADEFSRLTPALKREVGSLRAALDGALRQTAGRVGAGKQYGDAMREYKNAVRLNEAIDATKDFAVRKALPVGGLGYLGYRTLGDVWSGR